MTVQTLISTMLREEGGFQKAFREILDREVNMTLNEFCQVSGISQSTMYKILEERREPNLRTVRQIIKALERLTRKDEEKFIAVIASPQFMEGLPHTMDTTENGKVVLREYAVSTVEDAIIAAVRAEREGSLGVICAPIVASTIEKILSIRVYSAYPLDSVIRILDDIRHDF